MSARTRTRVKAARPVAAMLSALVLLMVLTGRGSDAFRNRQKVQKREWSEVALAAARDNRSPVAFYASKDAPHSTWAAMNWTLPTMCSREHLKDELFPLRSREGNPRFVYHAKGLPFHEGFHFWIDDELKHITETNLPAAEVCERIVANDNIVQPADATMTYEYSFMPIEDYSVLEADIGDTSDYETAFGDRMLNIFMSSKGVLTHTHYDVSDNFYINLGPGKKTVTLIDPKKHSAVKLFPANSVGYRQSSLQYIPNLLSPIDVILSPGESLFIPSYFFHRIRCAADSHCVAVNVWSKSHQGLLYEQILKERVVFDPEWDIRDQIAAGIAYAINVIVDAWGYHDIHSLKYLRKALFTARYEDYEKEIDADHKNFVKNAYCPNTAELPWSKRIRSMREKMALTPKTKDLWYELFLDTQDGLCLVPEALLSEDFLTTTSATLHLSNFIEHILYSICHHSEKHCKNHILPHIIDLCITPSSMIKAGQGY